MANRSGRQRTVYTNIEHRNAAGAGVNGIQDGAFGIGGTSWSESKGPRFKVKDRRRLFHLWKFPE